MRLRRPSALSADSRTWIGAAVDLRGRAGDRDPAEDGLQQTADGVDVVAGEPRPGEVLELVDRQPGGDPPDPGDAARSQVPRPAGRTRR